MENFYLIPAIVVAAVVLTVWLFKRPDMSDSI